MSQNLPKRPLRHFLFYIIQTISHLRARTVETSSFPDDSMQPLFKQIGEIFLWHILKQEPITRNEQLPNLAYVKAFLRTSLFLDTLQGTFSPQK